MPPSAKRRSGRKRVAVARNNVDDEPATSSPSRPAKKRRTNGAAALAPDPPVEDVEIEDNEDAASDETADNMASADVADLVIPHLLKANHPIVVAFDFRNKDHGVDESVSAFAKIAGKDWTYYVTSTTINIGRPPDGPPRQALEQGAQSSPGEPVEQDQTIHIDLGPSKLISRLHAKVFYNSDDEKWHIQIEGRNGLRINDNVFRRGQSSPLKSGDVIEIASTEMMFVAADKSSPVDIHPKYLSRLQEPVKEEDPSRWNNQPHGHPAVYRNEEFALPAYQMNRFGLGGQAPIAPAPSNMLRPTTPVKSPLKAPKFSQGTRDPPVYGRKMMMQGSEIDYASDAVKETKPACSYATLISQAILSSEEECLTLSNIYGWIMEHFSYYRHADPSWQNSIRHNLSLNPNFEKIPRRTDEPGKGMKWRIIPEKRDEFKEMGLKFTSRGGARQSSNPNSPAKKSPPGKSPTKLNTNGAPFLQTSPIAQTPPLSAYPPAPQESYTPTRGSRLSALSHSQTLNHPVLSDDTSPLPTRPRYLSQAGAGAGLPPYLSSSAAMYEEHNSGSGIFQTPAPQRHEPKPFAPSTAKLPSQYLQQSSPAEFWKMNMSTPADHKFYGESSPLKAGHANDISRGLQSSSPPPIAANGSPTRSRVLGKDVLASSQMENGSQRLGLKRPIIVEDDDDDAPIDLLGGFQKIGDRRVSNAAH